MHPKNRKGLRGGKSAAVKFGQPPLSPQEWDFRARNVPDGELLACALYEYAREAIRRNPHLQKTLTDLAASRRPRPPKNLPDEISLYLDISKQLQTDYGSPLLRPDMLDVPWQLLDERERKRASETARRLSPETAGHFTNTFAIDRIALLRDNLLEFAIDYQASAITLHGDASKVEFGMFAVDWNFPRERIEATFAKWLDKRLAERRGQKQRFNERGKLKADFARSWLKALGAKRLLESGLTATEASEYTAANAGEIAEPLFRDKAEWSKAKRDATKRLFAMFPMLA